MKNTGSRKKTLTSLLLALLMVFVASGSCFAYVTEATQGVNNPFIVRDVYYNSNGTVKTIYTGYNFFSFSLKDTSNITTDLTQVILSKETNVGSGKYDSWVNANVELWGASAGGGVGGVSVSCRYFRVRLPSEGRYKAQVYTFDKNGRYLDSQSFLIYYSESIFGSPKKIVNDATADTQAFTNSNGRSARISFTVHDLTYKGITASDIIIKFCNQKIMAASQGRASYYTPTDVTITQSTVNRYEYIVTATVNAGMYNYVSGEYYIDCLIRDNGIYKSYCRMFPRLYIN